MATKLQTYLLVIAGCLAFLASAADGQVFITEPKEGASSHFTSLFVAGTAPSNMPVTVYVNGVAADSGRVRPDGIYELIGVPVPQGPVALTVVVQMSGGRTQKAVRSMHVFGVPDSIAIVIPGTEFRADGRSVMTMKARILDRWGRAIPDGHFVTVDADSLKLDVTDLDREKPGTQIRLVDGFVTVPIHAPKTAGEYRLTLSTSAIRTAVTTEFRTPIEPLMLVGSADASGTMLSTTGTLEGVKDRHLLTDGFHKEGRLAFYGRGSIWSDYLLTASYDNERREDRLFKEVDPDVLYSLYGDNSTIDYTAQTNNPFFVKLERNRSYAMFGDFNTELTQNELARYDRTFNGAKAHLESKTGSADVFGTLTDRKVMQDELRGQGISGYYFLGHSSIVVGSEKVRIETRDRLHNEVIISRLEKARFGDYDIDYQQGTLFFKQPVPGIDTEGNPVYIVVTYEATTAVASEYSYVLGAQAEKEIVGGWRIGGTAVHDKSNNDFTLLGANTKIDLNKRLVVGGEFARGFDKLNAGGNAWKVDLGAEPFEKLQLKSYYRKIENGFINQTMGAGGVNNEAGSTKYGAGASYTIFDATKLAAEFYRSSQIAGRRDVVINSATGSIDHSFGSVAAIGAKVENVSYETPGDSSAHAEGRKSTIVGVRGSIRPFQRLNIVGEYERSLGTADADEVKPATATIGAELRIIDPVTISASQKFFDNGGSASVFGISSDIGLGTTAQARYQIGSAMSGQRNQIAIGLKNVLHITEALTSNVSVERTRALDRNLIEARTEDNDAVSVGLEYLPKTPIKATIKGEYGKNAQAIRRVVTFGGDLALTQGLSLIDKFSYYEESRMQSMQALAPFGTGSPTAGAAGTFGYGAFSPDQTPAPAGAGMVKKLNNIVGLAYRPAETDWLNAIGKYEKKMEFNGVVAPQASSDVNIVSIHTFIEPWAGFEIGTKYALKYATDKAFGLSASTKTDFYLVRAEYDLRWHNFDLAAEYRLLDSRIVGQAQSASLDDGYSAEIGYSAIENIRIGAGYNFAGTKDRDMIGREYWSAGPFVTFRAKFTEKLLNYFSK